MKFNIILFFTAEQLNAFNNVANEDENEDQTVQVNKYINFVNRQRGSFADMDDFTLFIRANNQRRQTSKFNISDMELPPDLEAPLIHPTPAAEPEEVTRTFHNMVDNVTTNFAPYPHDMTNFTAKIPRMSDITTNLPKEASSPVENCTPLHKRKRKTINQVG